jgi:hypothetical protein
MTKHHFDAFQHDKHFKKQPQSYLKKIENESKLKIKNKF